VRGFQYRGEKKPEVRPGGNPCTWGLHNTRLGNPKKTVMREGASKRRPEGLFRVGTSDSKKKKRYERNPGTEEDRFKDTGHKRCENEAVGFKRRSTWRKRGWGLKEDRQQEGIAKSEPRGRKTFHKEEHNRKSRPSRTEKKGKRVKKSKTPVQSNKERATEKQSRGN